MNCPRCGREIPKENHFCGYCGYNLSLSTAANKIVGGFVFGIQNVSHLLGIIPSLFTNTYDVFLAKSIVQRSIYGKQDPEQRNLFGIREVFFTQNDRICSYVKTAMHRELISEIESWQSYRVDRKKFIVSYRFKYEDETYKAWYWVVDFKSKKVREITRKSRELIRYNIIPDDESHVSKSTTLPEK